MSENYLIRINVQARYLEEQSIPDQRRYAFAYTITIQNIGQIPAQLISRHWIITDANGKEEEVRGPGVVGQQPHLAPGDEFEYTSGAIIETPIGHMRGSYQMHADDGHKFDAEIPAFTLSKPHVLH